MIDLWYPGARRWQGNPAVAGYSDDWARQVGYTAGNGARGPKRGAVLHSAEGKNWDVIHDLLLTKSWHFTIGYDRVEQHHPWDINTWHCGDTDDDGGVRGNFELDGIEALGIAGEPLTEYQVEQEVKINRWLAKQNDRAIFHRFDGFDPDAPGVWVLAEHNEVSNTFTECPSGRIPWARIMAELSIEEDNMTFIGIATDNTRPYKTWKLYVAADGSLKRQHIPDAEHREALEAMGFAVRSLTTGQLGEYDEIG